MFTQGKSLGTKGQLSHKSDLSEELNTPSPPINQDPFNFYGSNKSNSEQTLPPQKDRYVVENTPQTREQLLPRRVGIPLSGKYPQRNVHFRNLEGEVDRKQYLGVHDPILITPRHPENESSRSESEIPKRMNSPDSPSDPNGRYFSGTVEQGKGGNFYGYYFTPSPTAYPKTQRRFYSSTPHLERGFGDRSVPHRYVEPMMPRRLFSTTLGMQSNNYYEDNPHTHELPNQYFEEGPWQGNLKGVPENAPAPVCTGKYTVQDYQIRDLKEKDPVKTEVGPTIVNHPRDTDYAPSNPRSYDKDWAHMPPWRGPPKCEDEDGYPLPHFEEGLGSKNKRMRDDVRMKTEPNWSDTDQGNDSDTETHPVNPSHQSQKNMSALLDSSQQVSEVLSHLVEHQNNLQEKNLEIMERLVSRSTNSFVLDDIPVFDRLKGSVDFENWLLELDKAAEITGMGMLELAFSKSSGTPHKMIKRLRREKFWEYIKEKLQITYSKLATDVHASTDLNQNKQKRQEPLEDFIERFYQNYKRVTGEDPARTRNPHTINTFVQNLYNRDITK